MCSLPFRGAKTKTKKKKKKDPSDDVVSIIITSKFQIKNHKFINFTCLKNQENILKTIAILIDMLLTHRRNK